MGDAETLARIEALVIPPAWTDVWICPWPNGHIQAMGTDAAGRRQYRYHDAWRDHRDREKFERVLDLGRRVEALRRAVCEDLGAAGIGRERVLAAAVRLLDIGCFRIGGERYASEHETFGIATLRKEHVRIRNGEMVFSYPAKGAKWLEFAVRDAEAQAVVAVLARRRSGGDDLFAYKRANRWVDVRSEDVNAYIKAAAGGEFSAKDFRTWSATVLAATRLGTLAPTSSPAQRRRAVAGVVREVAVHLGNTPAVCRSSYIDPRVIDLFEAGHTVNVRTASAPDAACLSDAALRNAMDRAVVDLLSAPSHEMRRRAA